MDPQLSGWRKAFFANGIAGYAFGVCVFFTRNQLPGTVTEVNLGTVMATVEVRLDGGEQMVTASITKEAAVDLGLAEGTAVTVFVKSTEVALGVE